MDTSAALQLDNVSKYYAKNNVGAITDICLRIEPGEFATIIGPSGSGKTTLLNLMGGLDLADTGKVTVFGESPRNIQDWTRLRARKIGYVFQSFHLLPTLSALENVEIPLFGRVSDSTARRHIALSALERVGLLHRTDHMPAELSGGEQQRVAIARSLVNAPPVILADEPTGNLDSVTAQEILDLFYTLHREDGTTVVLITHEREIATIADRIVSLKDGAILSDTRRDRCVSRP
ncbi:MAG: ABC transporter ATP-binding protein [Desulfopila sp.]|nr:ABC transporter ATP-binding protein [Desulfopila sp.]